MSQMHDRTTLIRHALPIDIHTYEYTRMRASSLSSSTMAEHSRKINDYSYSTLGVLSKVHAHSINSFGTGFVHFHRAQSQSTHIARTFFWWLMGKEEVEPSPARWVDCARASPEKGESPRPKYIINNSVKQSSRHTHTHRPLGPTKGTSLQAQRNIQDDHQHTHIHIDRTRTPSRAQPIKRKNYRWWNGAFIVFIHNYRVAVIVRVLLCCVSLILGTRTPILFLILCLHAWCLYMLDCGLNGTVWWEHTTMMWIVY